MENDANIIEMKLWNKVLNAFDSLLKEVIFSIMNEYSQKLWVSKIQI